MSMFSKLVSVTVHLITGIFSNPTFKQEEQAAVQKIEDAAISFAKTDLGKICTDAINLAEAKFGTASGPDKFAAAKTQFLADAKTAGHDLESMAKGVVDSFVQLGYVAANATITALTTKAS